MSKCIYCDYTTPRSFNMKRHLKTKHNEHGSDSVSELGTESMFTFDNNRPDVGVMKRPFSPFKAMVPVAPSQADGQGSFYSESLFTDRECTLRSPINRHKIESKNQFDPDIRPSLVFHMMDGLKISLVKGTIITVGQLIGEVDRWRSGFGPYSPEPIESGFDIPLNGNTVRSVFKLFKIIFEGTIKLKYTSFVGLLKTIDPTNISQELILNEDPESEDEDCESSDSEDMAIEHEDGVSAYSVD